MACALLSSAVMKRSAALAIAVLIATGHLGAARADEYDTAPPDGATDAAAPGPNLPNGEPAPPPDLVEDTGGCSCRAVATATSPLPFVLAVLVVTLRRKPRA